MKERSTITYQDGADLDFYMKSGNRVIFDIVMENIQEDLGGQASKNDCMEEFWRLCEKGVRHYTDCKCALCR